MSKGQSLFVLNQHKQQHLSFIIDKINHIDNLCLVFFTQINLKCFPIYLRNFSQPPFFHSFLSIKGFIFESYLSAYLKAVILTSILRVVLTIKDYQPTIIFHKHRNYISIKQVPRICWIQSKIECLNCCIKYTYNQVYISSYWHNKPTMLHNIYKTIPIRKMYLCSGIFVKHSSKYRLPSIIILTLLISNIWYYYILISNIYSFSTS